MLTLISATPSPYARKNRIALLEKGIPFDLRSEIPWESSTETPKYNPLEKLPILLFDDGRAPIYESWYIQEYIVQKYAEKGPKLMPDGVDEALKAKQIQVVADGACDAMVCSGHYLPSRVAVVWLFSTTNRKSNQLTRNTTKTRV